ncbi:uncharacterized protein BP5553_06928 [Venustampulla echinocandica]|uniref:Histone chaperone domain-containing protein n=1 Tax=Venustampulla echinocandica TaxID=2656787 RepID=A0A370TI17_9HELO|nr:uncharacterized protein BP5553_06928 [Venustampulla echinocandica]RDL34997.1 hypothetical protein BP5553_06928 [Venustampulla echinocandica]
MSNKPNKAYTPSQDIPTEELLQGNVTTNNDYVNPRQGGEPVPIIKDETEVDHPRERNKPNSSARLQDDDTEAINKGNILKGRTRHATKRSGTYTGPGDNEGIPDDNGRSSTR